MTEVSKRKLRRLGRLGSYSTARVDHGRVARVERHLARLVRDAKRLGLAPPPPRDVEALLWEIAAAEFPKADGIIRVEWSCPVDPPGQPPELIATTRPLGDLPGLWRACIAETLHPGPEMRRNAKAVDVAAYDASREEMRHAGVEEVLLFQAEGWLVEGCRSNILVVLDNGAIVTPELALGGVEGIGLEIVRENRRDLRFVRIDKASLLNAREIMATNVVRGVVPIVELDGMPVGTGSTGPFAAALAPLFGRSVVA